MKGNSRLERILSYMIDVYGDKRSDVADIAERALRGQSVEDIKSLSLPEHRFVKFKYQGADFIYDTLTTLVETNGNPNSEEILENGGEWKTLKSDYDG